MMGPKNKCSTERRFMVIYAEKLLTYNGMSFAAVMISALKVNHPNDVGLSIMKNN